MAQPEVVGSSSAARKMVARKARDCLGTRDMRYALEWDLPAGAGACGMGSSACTLALLAAWVVTSWAPEACLLHTAVALELSTAMRVEHAARPQETVSLVSRQLITALQHAQSRTQEHQRVAVRQESPPSYERRSKIRESTLLSGPLHPRAPRRKKCNGREVHACTQNLIRDMRERG
jgi:hypothetical protein